MDFARANKQAMLLLLTATRDYSSARCLMLNGLQAGFSVGAQAIEKYLKATIYLSAPSTPTKRSHNLPALLLDAEALLPGLAASNFEATATTFHEFYQTRYPDNDNQPISMNTGMIADLDEMVIGINVMLPMPRNIRMRSGLFALVMFSLNHLNSETPDEKWIKMQNAALAPHWDRIRTEYFETMKEIYPQSPELHQ